ncbi:MAG: glycosyltransferase [Candidatus Micrarchaeota archaeon]
MLSVIVPVHNEAKILASTIRALSAAMDALGDYEIIISEDGSTDGTPRIAKGLASGNVRVISSGKRLGRGLSLSNAMRAARGDIVIYMDADLAADLGSTRRLVSEIEKGADISTGSRLLPGSEVVGRSRLRDFFSRGYNIFLRLLFRTSVRDHQCGFKAFRKSSILPLVAEVKDRHWFWDSELMIRAQDRGMKIAEIPIRWTDRKESGVKLESDIIYMGLAAVRLRLALR